MQLLQCTASLPRCCGQCNSCTALSHCLGAVGSGTAAMHGRSAWGQWPMQLLHATASLPGGSEQCNSYNAPPRRLGAVGSATSALHCLTAGGQWAVHLLQRATSLCLPGTSLKTLRMVAVGRIACTHCHTRSQSRCVVLVVPPRDSSPAIVALFRSVPPVLCTLSLSLLPCLQGLSAAPQVRPSPLLAPSYSQWTLHATISFGKTSTSPW